MLLLRNKAQQQNDMVDWRNATGKLDRM